MWLRCGWYVDEMCVRCAWHTEEIRRSYNWDEAELGWDVDEMWEGCGWDVDEIKMRCGWDVGEVWMRCGWNVDEMWMKCGWDVAGIIGLVRIQKHYSVSELVKKWLLERLSPLKMVVDLHYYLKYAMNRWINSINDWKLIISKLQNDTLNNTWKFLNLISSVQCPRAMVKATGNQRICIRKILAKFHAYTSYSKFKIKLE
jgi:hypothetical protein